MRNKLTLLFALSCFFLLALLPSLVQAQYHVAAEDLFLLKRQKVGAFAVAKTVGVEGLEVDMGGLGTRDVFDNKLLLDSVRKVFLETSNQTGIKIVSLAMSGFYSQSLAQKPTALKAVASCIETMKKMGVKVAFLPLGVASDLKKNPELRPLVVKRLRKIGKLAQKAHVVIGIETSLDAQQDLALLHEIGSPAIKIYFNFANAVQQGKDISLELRILGRDHLCQIHCTNTDGKWLENDPQVNLPKIKKTLDAMGWSGWLVLQRSRDINDPKNVRKNFSANAAYVKSIFVKQ